MGRIRKSARNLLQYAIRDKYILWKCKGINNNVALTFDDGPHPEFTPLMLDALDSAGVKATFFLIGRNARRYNSIARETIARGHTLGNHTNSHIPLTAVDSKILEKEILDTNKYLSDLSGSNIKLFRPPWGKLDLRSLMFLLKHKLQIVLWSVDSLDYKRESSELIVKSLSSVEFRGGEVILFHDDNSFTAKALPKIIANIRDKRIGFVELRN